MILGPVNIAGWTFEDSVAANPLTSGEAIQTTIQELKNGLLIREEVHDEGREHCATIKRGHFPSV